MAKILVIDDSGFSRSMLVRILELEGHTTIEAADGQVGLDLCGSESPDLILCDLLMPNVDGLEFVKGARGMGVTIPIWIVTADVQKETKDEALRLGANMFLNKPVTKEELLGYLAESNIK